MPRRVAALGWRSGSARRRRVAETGEERPPAAPWVLALARVVDPSALRYRGPMTRVRACGWPVAGMVALMGCGEPPAGSSDAPAIILRSGVVHTMDAAGTIAQALVVRDGEIVYVGDDEGTAAFDGPHATVVELEGRAVLPGLHDAHTHLVWSATDLLDVDLYSATTVDALAEAVRAWAEARPDAPWVRGGGWSMADFDGLLHASLLDAVVPDRPVLLYSADGHTAFVNSRALALAGITAATPDPEDGRIEHDADGEPTGVLLEDAASLVADLMPLQPEAQVDEGLASAVVEANALGLTTIIDASLEPWMLDGYARADAAGTLTLRVHGAALVEPGEPDPAATVQALRDRYGSERVVVDAAKLFVDGIIESQTAVMLEPYVDGTNGTPVFTDAELRDAALALDAAGVQLHAHVIGDGAVRQWLDVLDAVVAAHGPRDRRPLLAHLEVVDPADVPRFQALGALADLQLLWAYPDEYIQELTWPVIGPERSEWLYPAQALRDAGATLVGGSDWSVSSMSPFEAIEVAVTRQDPWADAGPVLTPQHRLDVEAAVRAYTSDAAQASFSEDLVGTLEVGKRADLVVLDRDPFTIAPSELSDVQVQQTWLDGVLVFDGTAPRTLTAAARRRDRRPHRCAGEG